MASTLVIERQGPVGLITFNRPERHNAFDDALIGELTEALRSMEAEDGVRVIVLSGAGRVVLRGRGPGLDEARRGLLEGREPARRDGAWAR